MNANVYRAFGKDELDKEAAGLRAALATARDADDRTLTIGLDAVPALNDDVINELICALRRLRDVGGQVRLHVTRTDLLQTLHLMALDRIFTIVRDRQFQLK
jgi:anti-anti-sigma regulatory factor